MTPEQMREITLRVATPLQDYPGSREQRLVEFATRLFAEFQNLQGLQEPVAYLGHDDFGFTTIKAHKDECHVMPLCARC